MRKFPQILLNVRVRQKPPLESIPALAERVRRFEAEMGAAGRIVLRYSGTEPLARVMIEGAEEGRINEMARELGSMIEQAIGEQG
jgi:phosphoglucosamine mutase